MIGYLDQIFSDSSLIYPYYNLTNGSAGCPLTTQRGDHFGVVKLYMVFQFVSRLVLSLFATMSYYPVPTQQPCLVYLVMSRCPNMTEFSVCHKSLSFPNILCPSQNGVLIFPSLKIFQNSEFFIIIKIT